VVIFHMHVLLCINILVYKHKYKKCLNKLLWTTEHFFGMIILYTFDLHLELKISNILRFNVPNPTSSHYLSMCLPNF